MGLLFLTPSNGDFRIGSDTKIDVSITENENISKQMDIYALGLVFWELSRRCQDLYQGVAVPPFELAYQKEIGAGNPSFEQMKNLLRRGVRPLFPEVWKNTNPAIQQLKETITDSWDDDSEARLNIETIGNVKL